jgi:ubiquinone/menaquinone biosynthesis C-methylase UbiE
MNPNVNKDVLWKMAMAFQVSKALFVASDLDIFTVLSKAPAAAKDLARKLKLHPRPLGRLLNAMVACGILGKRKERFFNTEIAETFLVKGREEYFGDYLSIVNDVYESWADYDKVIKENHSLPLFRKEFSHRVDKARVLDRSPAHLVRRIMHAQEAFSYRQAVCFPEVYDLSQHHLLLDVGGGTGIFSIMAVKANPHLKSIVFDVPQVCSVARKRIRFYKTAKKIRVVKGNFLTDELPTGADIALLSTILDGYDEPECRMLLSKVYETLPSHGVVVVNEMMLNEQRTGPLFPALFSLELMIERNMGDSRTVGEIRKWMKEAGFRNIKSKPLRVRGENYLNCKIVTGKKP